MADRLRFHPLVPVDLQQALEWYDGISPRIGDRFRERVDARLDEIERQPDRFWFAFGDVRYARVERFPYLILFRQVKQIVFVFGVFHAASDPQKWRQRLG